jgi:hypothetical protein
MTQDHQLADLVWNLHPLLDAQDSFTLENASHGMLFEKFVRRLLGNRDPRLATAPLAACVACTMFATTSLDDTIIVVHLLSEARDIRHHGLLGDPFPSGGKSRAAPGVRFHFIDLMLKSASFAHSALW